MNTPIIDEMARKVTMKKNLILIGLLVTSTVVLSACKDEKEKTDEVQKIAIVQGLKTASLFKSQLASYYTEHQSCDETSISSNDRALTKIHFVQDIVTTKQCQIIVTFKNDKAIPDLSGKEITLTMQPSNNTYNWECESNTSRKDLLPVECR